jgi:hypothetical protein
VDFGGVCACEYMASKEACASTIAALSVVRVTSLFDPALCLYPFIIIVVHGPTASCRCLF